MRNTTIKFYNNEYNVSVGDTFQAEVRSGKPGQIFLIQCNDDEKVYLEVLQKLSNSLCFIRVNEIQWVDGDKTYLENYNNLIEDMSLENMTKKELIQYCKENGITINTKLKKADIINEIKEI